MGESTPARHPVEFRSAKVEAVLSEAERVVRTRGFNNEGEEWRGFLVDQGSAVSEAPLHAGHCYVFAAAGASALRELDLRIYDSDGSVLGQNARAGSDAALQYCPTRTGTYYVAALATDGTGLFALRRYSGPSGLEIRLDDLFPQSADEGPLPEGP